jgi:hypothetical protein
MAMAFDYLLDKLADAEFRSDPFRHIWIDDLFTSEHFAAITEAPEIDVSAPTDEEVLDALFGQGYQIIDFPGCVTDRHTYLRWRRHPQSLRGLKHSACEGFGMALRLTTPRSPILAELDEFLRGDRFQCVLADKFGIDRSATFNDSGIQKYLDGYEISPHPDVRHKAVTYMVNINPAEDSAVLQHHTQYLRFTPPYRYVQTYWEGHPEAERCWVPWDWCETVSEQRCNNSLVAFAPDNSTMHGVKARYDHLPAQRTQLYGNLWHKQTRELTKPEWENLVVREGAGRGLQTPKRSVLGRWTRSVMKVIGRGADAADPRVIRNRLKAGKR